MKLIPGTLVRAQHACVLYSGPCNSGPHVYHVLKGDVLLVVSSCFHSASENLIVPSQIKDVAFITVTGLLGFRLVDERRFTTWPDAYFEAIGEG